jgi:hypothetical protein
MFRKYTTDIANDNIRMMLGPKSVENLKNNINC